MPESPASLPHFYQDIEGWFDYAEVYDLAIATARNGGSLVEVGSWLGRSMAYLAIQAAASGKNLKLHAVDTWKGSPSEPEHLRRVDELGGDLLPHFMRNMRAGGIDELVTPIQSPSVQAAQRFADESLDFVFIDGEHLFESVVQDIRAWLPKVRPGGVLAGHDVDRLSVQAAVQDRLPWSEVRTQGNCWVYHKQEVKRGEWMHPTGPVDDRLPSHLIFIPHIVREDLLARAVESVDFPGAQVVVIDGSHGGLSQSFIRSERIGVFRMARKLTFTQTMNWCQAEALRRKVDWQGFMHDDASCSPEFPPQLLQHAQAIKTSSAGASNRIGALFTNYHALAFYDVCALVDVGPWDETWEWYWSDVDYYHRMRRLGWLIQNYPGGPELVRHEVSGSLNGDSRMRCRVRRTQQWAAAHYHHKWGGFVHQERHVNPYDVP